jgi:Raf kinase inhibitor-like YbhB/YbcL family protein
VTVPAHPPRGLAWDAPNLAGPATLLVTSPDFQHNGRIPPVHAAVRAGGENLSPALTWTPAPADTAQLLLIIEDPDAPTRSPYIHCLAVLGASVAGLDHGALSPPVAAGVQVARSATGNGYLGPAPPKNHAPHRYVFELFALSGPVRVGPETHALSAAELADLLARVPNVLARGRLDGTYQRA